MTFDKTEIISEKQTIFKDKSDDNKKVVIVRKTLMVNFMSTTIFPKFWRIFCYCKPNRKVYKKTLVIFFKKMVKNCALNLNYRHQIVLFVIYCKICSSMRSFEWYNLNVHHVMGSW